MSSLNAVALMTERLEIRRIEKQNRIAAVRNAVIDVGRRRAALTKRLTPQ
jgi:hypothetical protein